MTDSMVERVILSVREPSTLTADEFVAEGKRLSAAGNMIVFLYPSQEWMAVKEQMPFLRYEKMPLS